LGSPAQFATSASPAPRRFRGHRPIVDQLVPAGLILIGLVVFGAPLAVGAVHPPAVLVATLAAGLGTALMIAGEAARGRQFRMTRSALLPLIFLLVPLLESVPLPAAIANRIDPAGHSLLADSPDADAPRRPLSLDPPQTRAVIANAAATLAVFLAALHLASGRSRRQFLIRVIAASTVAAVALGLGHRILGESQIYGYFRGSRGLLNGPFINSNHTAEFLELGAFVCVASALMSESALNRVGWLAAAIVAGAATLGTLSRGAIVALAAGTIVFAWLWRSAAAQAEQQAGDGKQQPRAALWIILVLVLLVALAAILGTDQLLAKVATTHLSQEARLQVWRDSFKIVLAHPFGIGRGAFDRVFPVYRHVGTPISVRFAFAENEPLQYLVEMGWAGFLAVAIAAILVVREWYRARRNDPIEAALVAALVAVLVHNCFDFGFETLGIALPFAAVLGTVLGRGVGVGERVMSSYPKRAIFAVCALAIVVGTSSLVHAGFEDVDALLEKATPPRRRELALRAQAAHPVDYFYVLAEAASVPIKPDSQGRSPRLHALNHALALCPNCPEVHSAVASTLWALGKRSQALTEWRTAVAILPLLYIPTLERAWGAGARPGELGIIAGSSADRLVRGASFLISRGQPEGAREVLVMASEAGAPKQEVLLITAGLDIQAGKTDEALRVLAEVRNGAPQDTRPFPLMADAYLRAGHDDQALATLDAGIGMNPHDLSMLRRRVEIILALKKWHLATNALAGLEAGLAEARQPTAELHLATARYYSGLRDYAKAGSEYNLFLMQEPGNTMVWIELASLWEACGRVADALYTYRQASMAAPGNPTVLASIQRLEGQIQMIRSTVPASP
jgi:Flp pilus assembly protein TadD/O-antigen ligase